MSLLTAALPRRGKAEAEPEPVRPPSRGRDRRAVVAVASLVVVCASVAAFADLYASAGHKMSAIVVEQPLVEGQVIVASQLGQADVSVPSGVAFIAVADASTLVGKRAASAIPAGSLLTPGDLSSAPALPAGSAVVGLALKDGQFPASGLAPGEQVMIVQTAIPGSPLSAPVTTTGQSTTTSASGTGSTVLSGSATGVLVAQATVATTSAPSANASGGFAVLVSVDVPSAIAPDVATASSAGQVSLVVLPSGTSHPATPATTAAGQVGASS